MARPSCKSRVASTPGTLRSTSLAEKTGGLTGVLKGGGCQSCHQVHACYRVASTVTTDWCTRTGTKVLVAVIIITEHATRRAHWRGRCFMSCVHDVIILQLLLSSARHMETYTGQSGDDNLGV